MSDYIRILYCSICKRLIRQDEKFDTNTEKDGVICMDCAQQIQEIKADE